MASKARRGAIRQVVPPGPTLTFQFNPETVVDSGGIGGWQEIARPRQSTALEWMGQPLRTVTFTLDFDGFEDGISVEPQCTLLERMAAAGPDGARPPLLQLLYGPVANPGVRWVVNDLQWGDELRDAALRRIMAEATVTLAAYHAGDASAFTPAEQHHQKNDPTPTGQPPPPTPGHKPLQVRAQPGDTLARIAARTLGDAQRWPELAALNGIRDPRRVTPGQALRVPAS